MTDVAEIVALIRDIAFLLLLLLAIVALLILFRKASSFLNSTSRIINNLEDIISAVAGPTTKGSGLVYGLRRVLGFVVGRTSRRSRRRRKGGRGNGE